MSLRIGLVFLVLIVAGCSGKDGNESAPSASVGTLAVASPTITVGESAGTLSVMVNRSGGSSGIVGVNYATTGATAVAGTEFMAVSGNLTWADGDATAKTVTVPILNSTPFSGAKSFTLALTGATGGATIGTPDNSTVTIMGDAVTSTLAFSAAVYSGSQGSGSFTATVERTGGSSGAASVTYGTADGTAIGGTDYTATSGILDWADGDAAAKTIVIPISSAPAFLGNKEFTLTLSAPNGAELAAPAAATVTIDGSAVAATGGISLSGSNFAAAQNSGSVTVSVNRSGGASGAASVAYSTANGSAVAGSDYTAATGTLSWASGDMAAKTFSVAISNASPFSGTKTFSVALSSVSGAVLGTPTSSMVTITGDAVASTLAIVSASYAVQQSAGALTVTVNRTGSASAAASVSYATANSTAVAGTDYTASSGKLTWAAGDGTAKTFSVAISNASPFSGTKTFAAALSNASGAVLGTAPSTTVTITGDAVASSIAIVSASYAVVQNAGALTVTVNRTGSASAAASVGYATANNTAVAGTDYTASSGKLTWAAGDGTAKTFSVAISNASPFTGTKSFAVAIAAPSGASLGTPSNASVTISGDLSVAVSGAMGQAAAARLLNQGTFGATLDTVKAASTQTYAQWFAAQAAVTPSLMTPLVTSNAVDWTPIWMDHVVLSQDQLRQRMAFALSEILVVSSVGVIGGHNQALVNYYDILVNNSLGNFRTLLQQVTLSPAMGKFLSMWQNAAASVALNTHADQNYAREVMQLFTVGLVKLNIDGTVQTDGSGNPLSTYSQTDVANLANVFTGWGSAPVSHTGDQAWQYDDDETDPMVAYQDFHDVTQKTIIGGVVVAAGGTAAADLKIALDTLFNHPNVGPFLSKQLIQRLVTSNPSPAYVQRVAQVFNNNGSGVRGDLLAVASAILSDSEAANAGGSTYGKLREPLLRLTELWRAFSAVNATGHTNEYSVGEYLDTNSDEYQLESPSVFNFFQPSFQLAGALTTANLVVPEFQILNENTLVRTGNELQVQTYQFIDGAGVSHAGADVDLSGDLSSTSVMLHTAEWESLAGTPAALVDQMNVVLMSGQMPTAMRTALIAYATGVPASSPGSRVAETAELLINSPQYAVQR